MVNSPSQLAKTQKIPTYETRIIPPGTKDAQARKLIEDYAKIEATLKLVKKFSPLNPLIFALIKKRLSKAVQQEFELYKSFPELVKKEKLRNSTEIVSSSVQQELYRNSQDVFNKLNNLIERNILKRQYARDVYSYKLLPFKSQAQTKTKTNSIKLFRKRNLK